MFAAMSSQHRLKPILVKCTCGVPAGCGQVLAPGWRFKAQAVSTALHPTVSKLTYVLGKLSPSNLKRVSNEEQAQLQQQLDSLLQAALALAGSDASVEDAASLERICKDAVKRGCQDQSVEQGQQNKSRNFRLALPFVRKAVMQWQHQIVNTWEATGYEHDSIDASQLQQGKPVRIEVDGLLVGDALDSVDLACAFLHEPATSCWSCLSDVLAQAGTHTITLSRYELHRHCYSSCMQFVRRD